MYLRSIAVCLAASV